MSDPDASDTGFDMESAVASVAEGLGLGEAADEEPPKFELEATPNGKDQESAVTPTGDTTTPPPLKGVPPEGVAAAPKAPPKSWAKEYHEDWSKLSPKQQEYIEKREKDFLDGTEQYRSEAALAKQYRDMLTPYRPMFAAAGVDEAKGVQYLLNAQYRLTNGTPAERARAYQELGSSLGLVQPAAPDPNAPPVDPRLQELQDRLNGVESALTQRQQADLNSAKADAQRKVDQFASDAANEHFDEVASDMVPFINSGLSLKDAYDKAVWANPVTREKELVKRQTAAETEKQKKAREEGEAAARATAHNVRGSQTSRKAPTEPKGKMEDTMRDTLKEIRNRAH